MEGGGIVSGIRCGQFNFLGGFWGSFSCMCWLMFVLQFILFSSFCSRNFVSYFLGMNLRSQSQSTSSVARGGESQNQNDLGRNQNTNSGSNSRFKAYNISADQEAAEIERNSDRPTSDFLLSEDDSLEEQEFKLREYRRRFSALTDQEVYQAQIRSEFEEMRKKLRTEEPVEKHAAGRKVSSHFTDRDGKLHTSYNKDINRSTIELSMPFLRMVQAERILDVCVDELHVKLDVGHARGIFLSKANMHPSLLEEHWESLQLWSSVENLSIMQKDKFGHILLFDGDIEGLEKFSLADFLVNPGSLTNMTYLKEALDNLELVYRCVMGEVFGGMSSGVKDFIRLNSRILSTRSFLFVRSVFEAGFVRFQMVMKSRDVSTGALPLNTQKLVLELFQECFDFHLDLFSRDEEEIFNTRLSARQQSSKPTGTRSLYAPKVPIQVAKKGNQGISFSKGPCIMHLAHALGISNLGGRSIAACSLGSACRFEHLTFPLSDAKRLSVVSFIKTSSAMFLRVKKDKDLLLSRI